MRALLAVYDKSGIESFARGLFGLGWELISTGGTFATLSKAGIPVTLVEEITHFPEMLDGRVKTLHPGVHGGILARRDRPEHMAAIAAHDIGPIDMVVCNLYPFEATVTKAGVTFEEGVENIDIGGPAMLRAAAKNHNDVLVVTNPADYGRILDALDANSVDAVMRRAADINVLHALFERDACFGDRAFEGVEVADDHVDRPDAVGGNCLHVRG